VTVAKSPSGILLVDTRWTVLHLRQARGEAVRRDTLDRDLGEADKDLAAAAVMTAGDSGAAMIAGLTEYQVQRLPTDRVDLVLAMAGLLMGLSVSLWRVRDR
jgi:hypothetical protein